MADIVIDTNTFLVFNIPPYVFMSGIGLLVAFSLYLFLVALEGLSVNKNGIVAVISFFCLLLMALLFGDITKILIALKENQSITSELSSGIGIVFYGGLTGFLLSFFAMQKLINKTISTDILNIVSVCIPLFHSFARIGCFFAGCCYGREADSIISIKYIVRGMAEVSTRIPVQLIEAIINFSIFMMLFVLYLKKTKKYLLNIYLITYAICRFILEFFRGDACRGVFGVLSFSQIYSLLIILIVVYMRIKRGGNKT